MLRRNRTIIRYVVTDSFGIQKDIICSCEAQVIGTSGVRPAKAWEPGKMVNVWYEGYPSGLAPWCIKHGFRLYVEEIGINCTTDVNGMKAIV